MPVLNAGRKSIQFSPGVNTLNDSHTGVGYLAWLLYYTILYYTILYSANRLGWASQMRYFTGWDIASIFSVMVNKLLCSHREGHTVRYGASEAPHLNSKTDPGPRTPNKNPIAYSYPMGLYYFYATLLIFWFFLLDNPLYPSLFYYGMAGRTIIQNPLFAYKGEWLGGGIQ